MSTATRPQLPRKPASLFSRINPLPLLKKARSASSLDSQSPIPSPTFNVVTFPINRNKPLPSPPVEEIEPLTSTSRSAYSALPPVLKPKKQLQLQQGRKLSLLTKFQPNPLALRVYVPSPLSPPYTPSPFSTSTHGGSSTRSSKISSSHHRDHSTSSFPASPTTSSGSCSTDVHSYYLRNPSTPKSGAFSPSRIPTTIGEGQSSSDGEGGMYFEEDSEEGWRSRHDEEEERNEKMRREWEKIRDSENARLQREDNEFEEGLKRLGM